MAEVLTAQLKGLETADRRPRPSLSRSDAQQPRPPDPPPPRHPQKSPTRSHASVQQLAARRAELHRPPTRGAAAAATGKSQDDTESEPQRSKRARWVHGIPAELLISWQFPNERLNR